MIISKQKANEVALMLTAKKEKELSNLQSSLEDLIWEYANKKVPKELQEVFLRYPEYFVKSKCISFSGNGFNNDYFSLAKSVVVKSERGTYLQPTLEESKTFLQLHNEVRDKRKAFS